ncbi:YciI family protein [Salinicoccus halodurans]|uniref:Uncharacterized conserved protein YciI, contains a putative active-site phosphohistidine n=1 Tax=Salinicoccus halodurans TaxID=407035 RepID=A0A0F7D4M7_9STAP|nr:YciI family protein [Salinicoccus halodurans]AKG74505.1 hypothetical protein AAT16_10055 [Salinicoccus halodurans]SFK90640.1 Uncharacterized conserved protein YciI, contains a putative active-site phosphohistidine [Salinicoccus halodurans]
MKYFAVFLPMKDEQKSKDFRAQHLEFLSAGREEGSILMNGRFIDGAGGLVIYKGESLETVEKLVNTDPYIINGARNYEIHEWEMESNYNF